MAYRPDKFSVVLVLAMLVLAGYLFVSAPADTVHEDTEYVFFYLPTCPHCHEQMDFHKDLLRDYPSLEITSYDVSTSNGRAAYLAMVGDEVRTPVTIIGNSTITGFGSAETTGEDIRRALEGEAVDTEPEEQTYFGKKAAQYSLPVLALILGLLDGFNPCAMWMLVYLLGLVATIPDKRRRWLIVGVFLAASAILYFLFMTAWLNIFLLVGVLRPVQILIGVFAIGFGAYHLREWMRGDPATCKVSPGRAKRYEKAKSLVTRPMSAAVLLGIIALAFAVNSVEFLCSAGIPAVFTGTLAAASISVGYKYVLIGIYVLMYMIDDLVIFLLAMFAIDRYMPEKYMHHTKLVTGIILLLLGVVLSFMPGLLI